MNSFCELRATDLATLSNLRFRRSFPVGSNVFVQGDRCTGSYILCEGRVKLWSCSPDGRAVTFGIAYPGEILGMSAALTETEYEVTAEAIDDCKVNFLSGDDLMRFLEEHPPAAMNAARQMSRDYQKAFSRVCSLSSSDTVANKLARLFLDWSSREGPHGESIRLENGVTHEALSEMIGVSRETVTRALKNLRENDVATLKGQHLTIHSHDRLLSFARAEQTRQTNGNGV